MRTFLTRTLSHQNHSISTQKRSCKWKIMEVVNHRGFRTMIVLSVTLTIFCHKLKCIHI